VDVVILLQSTYTSWGKSKVNIKRVLSFFKLPLVMSWVLTVLLVESMDWVVMLSTRVSHVLPVKLYDTTGDTDICVNELVAQAITMQRNKGALCV